MNSLYAIIRRFFSGLGLSNVSWVRNLDYKIRNFLKGEKKDYIHKYGLKIYIDPKNTFAETFREYEPESVKTLFDNLGPGDTFVDIGASIGWFSLIASKIVGDKGRVIAIEPHRESFLRLCRNMRENKFENRLFAYNAAASNAKGKTKLYTVGNSWQWSSTEKPTKESIEPNFSEYEDTKIKESEVETIRVDDVVPGKVDFIKLDVEGFVDPVFDGATETIKRNQNIKLLIEHPTDYIVKSLSDMGFTHGDELDEVNVFFRK